jgi:flavin-binding protein dodecin
MGVMNTIELTGVSTEGWGDAAKEALREASRTIRRINKLDVIDSEAVVKDGVISEYHTRVRIFFDIET